MSAIPIEAGQDFYVPSFQVRLRGRPLGHDVVRDILQVTYHDGLDEIDGFELTINNWDAETRSFKYADSDIFDPGKELELFLGYFGRDQRRVISGEITSLTPSYPSAGQPTLAVSGLNILHRLRKKQESHIYENMTDGQIAQQIAGRLGITPRTETGPKGEQPYPYLFQDNKYDIVFLFERARRIGYDLRVDESGSEPVLVFGPSPNVKRATYSLTYGRTLIDFQPSLQTANQVGKVTVRGWDAVKKEKIEYTAERSEVRTKGVGSEGRQAILEQAFGDREEVIADRPVATKDEAKTLAIEALERIAKDMVTGSGTIVGLPDVRTGTVLEVGGLGLRFSGRYFVTKTTHAIGDGGYTTSFDCRREEV